MVAIIALKEGRTRSTRPKDLFLIGEVYGSTGEPDKGTHESIAEITTKIQRYEIARGRWRDPVTGKWRDLMKRGCADGSIFDEVNERCIATEFERPALLGGELHPGIRFERADKGPNSVAKRGAPMREAKGLFSKENEAGGSRQATA